MEKWRGDNGVERWNRLRGKEKCKGTEIFKAAADLRYLWSPWRVITVGHPKENMNLTFF
jgi:hypothetical protein